MENSEPIFLKAEQFIINSYAELGKTNQDIQHRLEQIKNEIAESGSYVHTYEELEHGARMAWRNSNRCIGRLFWNSLTVFDERKAETNDEVKEALFRHIGFATNMGKIRPSITIFKPEYKGEKKVTIWNHQLIRYAGYETPYGRLGDPASIAFTEECRKLGWEGEGTNFDVLPLVIQVRGNDPVWFTLPEKLVKEVSISHPEFTELDELHAKWYAVPIISDMKLEIGGIEYNAAPFNGWYMGTEIGARNLADAERYNMLPKVASLLGYDTSRNASLWKDRALVELNAAVLHSFKEAGVSIVDHHTAASQFQLFEERESASGREVTGDWTWLIPPMSPAATHIFHKDYKNEIVSPNYFYQEKPY